MQKRSSDSLIFSIHLCFALLASALVTTTFVAAEVYATSDHMLADAEIAIGSPLGDITVAIAIPK